MNLAEMMWDVIAKLGAERHAQYVLSFAPEASAPGYHNLELRLARRDEFPHSRTAGHWSAEQSQ
jgi:hypothetical protein